MTKIKGQISIISGGEIILGGGDGYWADTGVIDEREVADVVHMVGHVQTLTGGDWLTQHSIGTRSQVEVGGELEGRHSTQRHIVVGEELRHKYHLRMGDWSIAGRGEGSGEVARKIGVVGIYRLEVISH